MIIKKKKLKNKFLGVNVTLGQNSLLKQVKKLSGICKTRYIQNLLDRNLVQDVENMKREYREKEKKGLI